MGRFDRGLRSGQTYQGVPEKLGAPDVSAGKYGGGDRKKKASRPDLSVNEERTGDTNESLNGGTVERRKRIDTGRTFGSLSAFIVPMKAANRPEGAVGGKECVGSWSR
jgi:hypothetical protein